MNLGGGIDLPFGRVKMTIAHHSSVLPDGSDGGNPGGFLLTLADGNDLLRLRHGAVLRHEADRRRRASIWPCCRSATASRWGPTTRFEAVKLLAPKRVVPSHYNTWPPIAQDAAAWAARVKAETTAEPIVVPPGGTVTL